jgi:hypothetical protein
MSDVDRLFEEFTAARAAGEDARPREYLQRASGADRAELGALIEGYLERAPRRPFQAERYRGSTAERAVETLTGGWPAVLPRWRDEARLPRDEVAARLAAALGVSDRVDKVHRYYHEMERGKLPPRGVSERVLEALSSILGRSAEVLRRAGEGLSSAGGMAAAGGAPPAFARMAHAPAPAAPAASVPPPDAAAEQPEPWDEVDELFRGGP